MRSKYVRRGRSAVIGIQILDLPRGIIQTIKYVRVPDHCSDRDGSETSVKQRSAKFYQPFGNVICHAFFSCCRGGDVEVGSYMSTTDTPLGTQRGGRCWVRDE